VLDVTADVGEHVPHVGLVVDLAVDQPVRCHRRHLLWAACVTASFPYQPLMMRRVGPICGVNGSDQDRRRTRTEGRCWRPSAEPQEVESIPSLAGELVVATLAGAWRVSGGWSMVLCVSHAGCVAV